MMHLCPEDCVWCLTYERKMVLQNDLDRIEYERQQDLEIARDIEWTQPEECFSVELPPRSLVEWDAYEGMGIAA